MDERYKVGDFDYFGKDDLFYICGNFHEFYVYEKLLFEPSSWGDMEPWQITYAVSLAEKLCREHKDPIPDWILSEKFKLFPPYWAPDPKENERLRIWLIMMSPPEAKRRHLFITPNSFERC